MKVSRAVVRCGTVTSGLLRVPVQAASLVLALASPAAAGGELDFIDRPLVGPEPPAAFQLAGAAGAPDVKWTTLGTVSYRPEGGVVGVSAIVSFATTLFDSRLGVEPALLLSGSSLFDDSRAGAVTLSAGVQPEPLASETGGGISFEPGVSFSDAGDVGAELAVNGKFIPKLDADRRSIFSAGLSASGSYGDDFGYRLTGALSVGRKLGRAYKAALSIKPAIGATPFDGNTVFGGSVEGMVSRSTSTTFRGTLVAKVSDFEAASNSLSFAVKLAATF